MRTADASSREEESIDFFGDKTAIRYGISLLLCKLMLTSCLIKTSPRYVVNVEVEVRIVDDIVLVLYRLLNVLSGERFLADKVTALTHTDEGGGT